MMLRVRQGAHARHVRGLLVTPLRFWKKGRFEDGEARALAQLAAAQEEHQRRYAQPGSDDPDADQVSALQACLCWPAGAWGACSGAA